MNSMRAPSARFTQAFSTTNLGVPPGGRWHGKNFKSPIVSARLLIERQSQQRGRLGVELQARSVVRFHVLGHAEQLLALEHGVAVMQRELRVGVGLAERAIARHERGCAMRRRASSLIALQRPRPRASIYACAARMISSGGTMRVIVT